MDSFLYHVAPQLLMLVYGALLGMWGILVRRNDRELERYAVRLGQVGTGLFVMWLVAVTVVQRQLPMLNPGQLAFFLGLLIWLGQCYSQRHVEQRLFTLLPLLGVLGLMIFGTVWGLDPDAVTRMLIGVGPAFHVALSLAGVALLLGCGVYGGGHVILNRQIRNRSFDTWFQKLPSLGDLDRLRRVTLTTGTALVTLSLLSASVWARFQPADQPTVVSHQHPMLLLVVILAVLVAADRFRWLSSRHLAVVCLVMSAIVLALLTVSVIEIFAGRYA